MLKGEYYKKRKEILKNVPKEFHKPLIQLIEENHGGSYENLVCNLKIYVDTLLPYIKKYGYRMYQFGEYISNTFY